MRKPEYCCPKGWSEWQVKTLVRLFPHNSIKILKELTGKSADEILLIGKRYRLIK